MRIHHYTGREDGTMLIATQSELRGMANELLANLESKPETADAPWPPSLFTAYVSEAPKGKEAQYEFSIHLETSSGEKPGESAKQRFAPYVGILALIGIWQLISWVRALVA